MPKGVFAQDRKGEAKSNNWGSKMRIIEYKNIHEIIVEFIDYGITKKSSYKSFAKGNILCPFDKTVNGIGFIGIGKYNVRKNGKRTREYATWQAMIERCYNNRIQEKYQTYKGCFVCEEWHNFQNFAKWYHENFYQIGKERMQIDKDILVKGNKEYSPEKCIFVPSKINSLLIKCDKSRGSLPIGVSWSEKGDKYKSSAYGKNLGLHNTIQEAFLSYKAHKENTIRKVAAEYRNAIPEKLYKALLDYQVEITD